MFVLENYKPATQAKDVSVLLLLSPWRCMSQKGPCAKKKNIIDQPTNLYSPLKLNNGFYITVKFSLAGFVETAKSCEKTAFHKGQNEVQYRENSYHIDR